MTKTKSRKAIPEPAPVPDLGAAAAQMNAALDQFEALIPEYRQPDPVRAPKVRANARFARELITPTITAVTNYEPLREHNLFDVDGGRHALVVREQLAPLVVRMNAIAAALAFTIDSKLAGAAMETLQTYQWAKRHADTPEGAALRPYVAEMRRVVARAMNRRPKPDAPTPQSFIAEPEHEIVGAGEEATR